MKKMKVIILSMILCMSFSMHGWASTVQNSTVANNAMYMSDVNERAEVTKWYYRTVDGVKEKRLWSVTYGYWITDWMPD